MLLENNTAGTKQLLSFFRAWSDSLLRERGLGLRKGRFGALRAENGYNVVWLRSPAVYGRVPDGER